VAIRFNLAAREAVEKAVAAPKADTVKSDNLRWGLSPGTSSTEKPLGKAPQAAPSPAVGADQ
jgi:hypothetical protein